MMPVFHVRSDVPLGPPTNTSGSPRPLLPLGLRYHTVHYAGVPASAIFFARPDGVFDTLTDAFRYLGRVEEVARSSGKPYEYNTMIPVMRDPYESHVIAYADEYQAAHSAGENAIAHGTQFCTGVGTELSPGAVEAFRWWHAVLLATGRLAADSAITPHRLMPGAATICPGPAVERSWPQLTTPYSIPSTPEPEEPTMTDAKPIGLYLPNLPDIDNRTACVFVAFASGAVRRATGPDVQACRALGVSTYDCDSPDHYEELRRAAGTPAAPFASLTGPYVRATV